jgi:peptide/nickel transport system substrate-binding protein
VLIIGGNAVSTNKIIYDVNPYYRDADKPFFSQLELRGGGDLDLAVQAGKEGNVGFIFNLAVTPDKIADMESGGHTIVASYQTSFTERIMINFADPNAETTEGERSSLQFPHPFLTDINVRKAMAMAINRDQIAEWYGDGGVLTTNILAQPPYFASPNTSIEYNPEKAAALLDEAGWVDSDGDGVREKDGVELRLSFLTSIQALRQQTQEQVKKDLEAI